MLFSPRFILVPTVLLSLLVLGLVYTYTRARNPLVQPVILLLIAPDVLVSLALMVHQHPSTDSFNCDIMQRVLPALWMLKSICTIACVWVIHTWIVEDHVAHVEWSRAKSGKAIALGASVLVATCLILALSPWYAFTDNVCMLPDPRLAAKLVGGCLFVLVLMMLVWACHHTWVAMNHTLNAMIQATEPLNALRTGLSVVLIMSTLYLFLQTFRYFVWMVLAMTLNVQVYHQATMAQHATFLSKADNVLIHFDYCVLWLDIIGLWVLLWHLPQTDDFLAIEKHAGLDMERQLRKLSSRPSITITTEPFITKPSEKKDDVLFVAPVTPSLKQWSPMDAKDAKLLNQDMMMAVPDAAVTRDKTIPSQAGVSNNNNNNNTTTTTNDDTVFEVDAPDDFAAFKRQSYIDQANIFQAVDPMPSIQEHDDESMHDVLMSSDDEGARH